MEAYQQRVIDEKNELGARRGKLIDFLTSDKLLNLPFEDQKLLERQANAMKEYLEILEARIARFK